MSEYPSLHIESKFVSNVTRKMDKSTSRSVGYFPLIEILFLPETLMDVMSQSWQFRFFDYCESYSSMEDGFFKVFPSAS